MRAVEAVVKEREASVRLLLVDDDRGLCGAAKARVARAGGFVEEIVIFAVAVSLVENFKE